MVRATEIPELVLPTHAVPAVGPGLRETPASREVELREARIDTAVFGGGAAAEVLLGLAAVVLAIFGLGGLATTTFAAIATLVVGGALVAYSGAVVLRGREVIEHLEHEPEGLVEVVGGVGAEVMGGGGAVLLAILALVGLDPGPLLAVAAIALGAGALYGGAGQAQLDVIAPVPDPARHEATSRAMRSGNAALVVAGLLAGTLGVLGVVGVAPAAILALVATLVLGVALALAGAATAYRFTACGLARAPAPARP